MRIYLTMNQLSPAWGTFSPSEKNKLAEDVRLNKTYIALIASGQREPLPKSWNAIMDHPMVVGRIEEIMALYDE